MALRRLFPGNLDSRNAANTDKTPPPDNNPGNDTVDGGYEDYPVRGVVFPGRGQELHGVIPPEDPWGKPQIDDVDVEDHSEYVEHFVPDPIPVYVVSKYAHESKTWNTQQINVGLNPREIVGRNLARTRLRIRNLHATVAVYIGRANMASYIGGFPLDPGMSLELNSTDEVWGLSADPAQSPIIAVLQEYSVTQETDRWH